MFWLTVIAVVLVVSLVLRRVLRGRRSPELDQQALEEANYRRVGQDVHNFDQRYGGTP
jgi:flagellar biogenesis protein FliO